MESIRGREPLVIDGAMLQERMVGYVQRLVDLGTGDGRFVQHIAQQRPGCFALGIDACRENLRQASSKMLSNTLYLIANASTLPHELDGLATHITINFPWGSLLAGLLEEEMGLHEGVLALGQSGARLELRLNGGALAEAGWSLEEGSARINSLLRRSGFDMQRAVVINAGELRRLPTTWAKRLAYGRDPRAVLLRGVQRGE